MAMFIGWLVMAALLSSGFAMLIHRHARLAPPLLAVFWLAMAAINGTMAARSTDYAPMADDAFIPGVRAAFQGVVDAMGETLFPATAALYQVALAALILAGGRYRRAGLLGSILYFTGVSTLGYGYMPTLLLIVPVVMLLRREAGTRDERGRQVLRTRIHPRPT